MYRVAVIGAGAVAAVALTRPPADSPMTSQAPTSS